MANTQGELETGETLDKQPLTITFVVMQHMEPNSHWYDVIPLLFLDNELVQRMPTMLCWEEEGIEHTKEGVCFLLGERFDVPEAKEKRTQQTYRRGQIVKLRSSEAGQEPSRIWNDAGIDVEVCSEEDYQRVLQERDFTGIATSFFPKEHVLSMLP